METQQKVVLAVLMLGTLMGSLDSTIVILAFPTIADSFHSDLISTLWVILIYLLVVAVTTTQLGRIGDIYGRSRMFNTGFGVFTLGSLFCGLSPSIWWLIASRAVQALGGALMQANSGAIVADTFPPNQRGAAFGYISLGWTGGAMLGIVLGGVITTFVGWEYIFFINLPIGIVATVLGVRYVRDEARVKEQLDILGMILLGTALSLISYGAIDFAARDLALSNIGSLLAGVVALVLFFAYELRISRPIMDFSALGSRILRVLHPGHVLPLPRVPGRGLPDHDVPPGGPGTVTPLRGPPPHPGLRRRVVSLPRDGQALRPATAPGYIATAGAGAIILATLVYLSLRIDTPLWFVLVASAISGTGTSMFFPANNSAVMAHAPHGTYGGISGLLRTMQNIGILGSFVTTITVAAASIPREVAFEVFIGTTNLKGGVSQAFIQGIDAALWISLVLIAIAGVLSWLRGEETRGASPLIPGR